HAIDRHQTLALIAGEQLRYGNLGLPGELAPRVDREPNLARETVEI
ncbi:MAG: hypothetical protein RLZZ623_312, partial [Actinomycetota bacterium]